AFHSQRQPESAESHGTMTMSKWEAHRTRTLPPHADSTAEADSRSDRAATSEPLDHAANSLSPASTFLSPSPYAYVFYATQDEYACSVLVNIQRLQDVFHTQHRIFVLASLGVAPEYIHAMEVRNVTVSVQTPPRLADGSVGYYQDCLLKLLGFKMHEIEPSLKRVMVLDADQLILKNMDGIFAGLPEVDLAAPRAYWIAKDFFSSTFMLINLSERLWKTVQDGLAGIKADKYDMDLANELLGDTVMMLPGRYATPNSHWEDWNVPKWYHSKNSTVKAQSNETHTPILSIKRGELIRRSVAEEVHFASGSSFASDSTIQTSSEDDSEADESNIAAGHATDRVIPPNPSAAKKSAAAAKPPTNALSRILPSQFQVPSGQSVTDDNSDSDNEAGQLLAPFHILPPSPPPPPPAVPSPPLPQRPLYNELTDLQDEVAVLHFFALGKPWTYSLQQVAKARPTAHPMFLEQFRIWRQTAREVCPGGETFVV
ncbi:hypothetical protein LTR60_001771, partial [Cryomyces antarcticus]